MGRDLLAGRTTLVTGGSGGIGRALALQLAAEWAAVALGFRTGRESAERLAAEIAELRTTGSCDRSRSKQAGGAGRARRRRRVRARADRHPPRERRRRGRRVL